MGLTRFGTQYFDTQHFGQEQFVTEGPGIERVVVTFGGRACKATTANTLAVFSGRKVCIEVDYRAAEDV